MLSLSATTGIVGAFQVNLLGANKSTVYEVEEKDDSGIFRAKYNVLHNNDTHAHFHRMWTNYDYQQFADGTPVKGKHNLQSYHSAHVLLKKRQSRTGASVDKGIFQASQWPSPSRKCKKLWKSGYRSINHWLQQTEIEVLFWSAPSAFETFCHWKRASGYFKDSYQR